MTTRREPERSQAVFLTPPHSVLQIYDMRDVMTTVPHVHRQKLLQNENAASGVNQFASPLFRRQRLE
jgi:hypothetical protein